MSIKQKVAEVIGKDNLQKLFDLLPKEIKLSTGEVITHKGELKEGVEIKLYAADGKSVTPLDKVYTAGKQKLTIKDSKVVKLEDIKQEEDMTEEEKKKKEEEAKQAEEGAPPAGEGTVEERLKKLEEMVGMLMDSTQAAMSGVDQTLKAVRLMADHLDGDDAPKTKATDYTAEDLKQIRLDRIIEIAQRRNKHN